MKAIKIIFFFYITLKICNFNTFQDIYNFIDIFILHRNIFTWALHANKKEVYELINTILSFSVIYSNIYIGVYKFWNDLNILN